MNLKEGQKFWPSLGCFFRWPKLSAIIEIRVKLKKLFLFSLTALIGLFLGPSLLDPVFWWLFGGSLGHPLDVFWRYFFLTFKILWRSCLSRPELIIHLPLLVHWITQIHITDPRGQVPQKSVFYT